MRIILRGVPPSLNAFAGRENTWEYRKAKKEWTKAMVRIDYYFPDRRRHDADNYCGKLLLDGLTKADVIADDDFAHISLSVHGYVDRTNPRTEITVLAEDE